MQFDAQSLAKEIVGGVAAAKAGPGKTTITAMAVKPSDFCGLWPQAKPILELLAGVAIFIPGAGATAGAVLQGLIKVGDQVAGQMCQ
jgi:hypothetical protein